MTEPRQARSRRTLERIVRAARELIAERGVDGVTVLEIVERARSSIGSFYARFPGKVELVSYLNERTRMEAAEQWEAAVEAQDWQSLDFRSSGEALVGMLLRLCREDPAWCRAFIDGGEWDHARESADSDRIREERILQDRVLRDFHRILLHWSREITHPSPDLAIQTGFRILIGGIRELMVHDRARFEASSEARAPLDDERLASELSRSYLGYLGARTAPDGDLMMDDPFNIYA